jgi:hypothetical protein
MPAWRCLHVHAIHSLIVLVEMQIAAHALLKVLATVRRPLGMALEAPALAERGGERARRKKELSAPSGGGTR